ncbi:hypothetical protein CHGG_00426 [Chaetomium globosum CBS 148.51]|uniref:Delta 8-(E)-sphingolipid desaturase n=1 Tax=Chaetomium globosum (strain ATCC 6205 / CBS 148.51 / DSM 1962 / NBRC 6347 / NRRL 1970) TaxID=306901 RepID=Q2HH78_CHAGB|nr:uncharacterized protein CHGG_00426 [Chaetomium globosum CBS 148.51]EAQ92191.1 hypothetical protein CHGG_00426 [Chaetomium globosum CBS 148.51]
MAVSTGSATPGVSQPKGGRSYPVISRREIEAQIAEGRTIFILEQYVIKADAWLKYHPGGDKAIMHMVGRDATDEVTILHSLEARRMMEKYRIGRIEGRWKNFLPPVQGGKFRLRVGDGKEQEEEYDGGLITRQRRENATASSSDTGSRSPSPTFDSDDAGPDSGLRKRKPGMARSNSETSLSSLGDGATPAPADGMAHLDMLTRKEIKLDLAKYPSLEPATQDAIVEKYRLLHERIKAEGLFNCNYWAYAIETSRYLTLLGLTLLFLSWKCHFVTTPVHVQITLSHFAMSTADLGVEESFPQKMLRTTMDVDCPPWLDFFHGGVQFQAIHHLFPRIPRHNLRKTQRLVQEFCDDVGIPYALYGFVDGNKQVIGRLADVARQAAILAKCQSVMAASEPGREHHHHH